MFGVARPTSIQIRGRRAIRLFYPRGKRPPPTTSLLTVFGNDAINSRAVVRNCPLNVEPNPWPQNHTPFFIRAANTPPITFLLSVFGNDAIKPHSHTATQPRSYSHSNTATQTHSHAHSHPATDKQPRRPSALPHSHVAAPPRSYSHARTVAQPQPFTFTIRPPRHPVCAGAKPFGVIVRPPRRPACAGVKPFAFIARSTSIQVRGRRTIRLYYPYGKHPPIHFLLSVSGNDPPPKRSSGSRFFGYSPRPLKSQSPISGAGSRSSGTDS